MRFFSRWAAGFLLACTTAAQAHAESPRWSQFIFGGAERRCSSFGGYADNPLCLADWSYILAKDPAFANVDPTRVSYEREPAMIDFRYQIDAAHVHALRAVPRALLEPQRRQLLLRSLGQWTTRGRRTNGPMDAAAFDARLDAALEPLGGLRALPAAEHAIVRSAFVRAEVRPARKLQLRSNRFSRNRASAALLEDFVAQAGERRAKSPPLIALVTASGGPHPFVDHDINVYALRSAGARVVYLPMDAALWQAMAAKDCAHLRYYLDASTNADQHTVVAHIDLRYPELFAQQLRDCRDGGRRIRSVLQQADGLYLSGGNQARHVQAFALEPRRPGGGERALTLVQRRHAEGAMVVAGTSAGNHAQGGGFWRGQPVPMIGGGDPYIVLRSGFLQFDAAQRATPTTPPVPGQRALYPARLWSAGGLGLFSLGVLDSHFSERTREARLVRAVHDSGMDYGFGVDENTALLVARPDANGRMVLSVRGAGGVWVADLRQARRDTPLQAPLAVNNVRIHYLQPGDRAWVDASGELNVELAPALLPSTQCPSAVISVQHRLLDPGHAHFRSLILQMAQDGANAALGTTQHSQDPLLRQDQPAFFVQIRRDAHSKLHLSPAQRLSYSGLLLQIGPCEGSCPTPEPDIPPPCAS